MKTRARLLGAAGLLALALMSAPAQARDYRVEEAMVPMRDGTALFTLIVIPDKAARAPILLTRTPFGAKARLFRPDAEHVGDLLGPFEAPLVEDGYIRVFQDVRGRGGSRGDYVVTRPLRGPLNPTAADHATDAYDTIDWLVKHLAQSDGRVGVIGWSYDGFTAAMALVQPHPALKAAVLIDPMVDGWMGDDWFHHGAYRQISFDFIAAMAGQWSAFDRLHPEGSDDFAAYLNAGSAAGMAKAAGLDGEPFWTALSQNPAYAPFWKPQALDRLLARARPPAPVLWVGSLWDQEDSWGATHGYQALEGFDRRNDRNFLVLGPWRHAGVTGDGSKLGPMRFSEDTAATVRTSVLKPFLDAELKEGAAKPALSPVLAYRTGENRWQRLDRWPEGPRRTRLYLGEGFTLTAKAPAKPGADRYRADPADPVPYLPRPIHADDPDQWRNWLSADQRFLAGRADVLSYSTAPLAAPLAVSGAPRVDLYAATTGSDADWVVKLIDVFPDGYQLMISADIFRGRYRQGFDLARPLVPGRVQRFRFGLTPVNHVVLPGHRLMVQVQSSWFPVYDRNPQTFVGNIFLAQPQAYRAATQTISRAPGAASSVSF
jgi:putative CocE/NonD family hydrolase